ncbi:MAG TPA: DUF3347 domain-containing protein [Agriterribacter sp.]|nr:DUF3347 domain-containing protein [Agriterribacter sp.]
MKNLIIMLAAIAAIAVVSCNSNSSKNDRGNMNHDSMTMPEHATAGSTDVKTLTPTFTNVDAGVRVFMKSLVQHYLAVKNALTGDDKAGAATAAGKMEATMKNFDKSLLTEEQKNMYDNIADDLKEHAELIGKSELDPQREHFAGMSKDMYELVKGFGAGMTLYHDHCPMYNDGSMWLSETEDIQNPYYGPMMDKCGSVEEVLQ